MNRSASSNYLRIPDIAKSDPEYLRLFQQYQPLNAEILRLLNQLSDSDFAILMDYIGTMEAIEIRLLEIACLSMVFPE